MVYTERRGSVKAAVVLIIFLIALSAAGGIVFREPVLKFLYLRGPEEYEITQPTPEGSGTSSSPARPAKESVPESTAPPTPPITPAPTPKITPKPTPTPAHENCNVYTYQDKFNYGGGGKRCLDKITITGIYFVAKNQSTGVKAYWKDSMVDIFSQIKNFYENQFNNKIQITIDTPLIVYGDKNIEDYVQLTIDREIRQKVQTNTINSFVVLMYYPIQGENDKRVIGNFGAGGGVGNSSSVMNNYIWLDPEFLGTVTTKVGADYSGYLGSAHEFGHALGIPHPWGEEVNRDTNGNLINPQYGNDEIGSLMSYGGQRGPLIPNSFIRTRVKQKMIISR